MDISLIKDLVDLAKNGYKPSDVKELLNLMKESEPVTTEPTSEVSGHDISKENTFENAFEKLIERND